MAPDLKPLLFFQSLQVRFQLVMYLRLQEKVISPDSFWIRREWKGVPTSKRVFFLLAY